MSKFSATIISAGTVMTMSIGGIQALEAQLNKIIPNIHMPAISSLFNRIPPVAAPLPKAIAPPIAPPVSPATPLATPPKAIEPVVAMPKTTGIPLDYILKDDGGDTSTSGMVNRLMEKSQKEEHTKAGGGGGVGAS